MITPLAFALYSYAPHLYMPPRPPQGETRNIMPLRELQRHLLKAYPLPSVTRRACTITRIGDHMSNILKLQRIEAQTSTLELEDSTLSASCPTGQCASFTSVAGCGQEPQ